MSIGNRQSPSTSGEKLPTELDSYGELYSAFLIKKEWYKQLKQLPGDAALEHLEEYADFCLSFLDLLLRSSSKWQLSSDLVTEIGDIRDDLGPFLREYSRLFQRDWRQGATSKEFAPKKQQVERCLEQVEKLADEVQRKFSGVSRSFREGSGASPVDFTPRGVSSFQTPRTTETGDTNICRKLKEDWTKYLAKAELCNKIVLKLHESDKDFAKKSLREIHGEIFQDLCDELEVYLDFLKSCPLEHIQATLCQLPLPSVIQEIKNFKQYLAKIDEVDIRGTHDYFSLRIYAPLRTINLYILLLLPG